VSAGTAARPGQAGLTAAAAAWCALKLLCKSILRTEDYKKKRKGRRL